MRFHRPLAVFHRLLSTAKHIDGLSYTRSMPAPHAHATDGTPLLILHGLFGSKQNWRSLSKRLADELKTAVYAIDLRNHGDSPHADAMSYPHFAADLRAFMLQHQLQRVNMMGHSMGGKVAMQLALESPDHINNLVVVDIAPVDHAKVLSSRFTDYVQWMKEIQELQMTSAQEAFKYLNDRIQNNDITYFLLTNLKSTKQGEPLQWRVNLTSIDKNLWGIGTFPIASEGKSFTNPSLFIAGTQGDYITRDMHHMIKSMFSKAQFEEVDAGHWVHAEQPHLFTDIVVSFLKKAGQV